MRLGQRPSTRVLTLIGVLFSGAMMSGCVTNTAAELRNDPESYDGAIQIQLPSEVVFRNLRDVAKNCLEQSPMGTPVLSDNEFDSSTQTGQIRQRMTAQQVLLNMTIIDLAKNADTGTELKLYTIKGWRAIGVTMPKKEDLIRWASGDKVCWKNR